MVDCIIPHGTLAKSVINIIYSFKCSWARVPVWLNANLNIATKKILFFTVEAIHALTETLGTIDKQ
jgi:hypothetical protein